MTDISETTAAAGAAIGPAVALFMLHPETFAGHVQAGYENPLSGYVAGRGGVLGEASGATVSAVFAVFEPHGLAAMWDEGVAVRGAAGAAQVYWEQAAEFGRKYLDGVEGLDRIAALGEKVIAATPTARLPLYAGWAAMPLADDAPARALQVMFVLRELRGGVHFNALSLSDVTPAEAHLLNKGPEYAATFGWTDATVREGTAERYAEVEELTNRRMTELFSAALEPAEAAELASLSAGVLEALTARASG